MAALRHGVAGIMMGMGAALILFGLPVLSPHALPSWVAIIVGVALALLVRRATGRSTPTILCEGDICRASL